jgi:peptidoglycan hydrolase-like protein with peptidoglycan-binding domain
MPLSSRLFQGDAALEAAANDDSAHITPGARGPHVEKIQTALNILDSAGLGVDGRYGPATATAVLNYKTKRNIINRSYQTSADNIVGKMTMAKLVLRKRSLRHA